MSKTLIASFFRQRRDRPGGPRDGGRYRRGSVWRSARRRPIPMQI